MALLEARALVKRFGGLVAVNNVDLDVEAGEIRGIIGPNGAGKTTLFNLVSGALRLSSGTITFNGEVISGRKPSHIAKAGLVRTFQRNAMFPNYTVLENVLLSRHTQIEETLFKAIFGTDREEEERNRARAREILEFLELDIYANEQAENLAHGHQRLLGIANALAVEPRLIMLDEPVAGMNPTETAMVTDHIRRLRDEWNMTVILVEHDMRTVMEICEYITVINFGSKLMEGTPKEVSQNPEVIEAYLGSEEIDI
ncbi:ABC transporter ATP-binding protein [Paralimibaculum aggregatum]|uniref:ABC transporter ATP-binding protein n=1 Tax=Paralimibaculum aggregatum TaxID=3036245 RepID=A0ABQ6LQ33_9RHOB|nr:ABC transporter ATP-binding protein [Limibaculum sp. NKW23]GMG83108.1 ABC transporter ATP-binding protein [Limibaculum sp. NKW23]